MAGKRGGARPGAGRPKKQPAPAPALILEQSEQPVSEAEIARLARSYLPSAMKRLALISQHGKSETASVAAANALLDRSFGRGRPLHLTAPSDQPAAPLPPSPKPHPGPQQPKLSGFADLLSSTPN
jgi:hypothetical protein